LTSRSVPIQSFPGRAGILALALLLPATAAAGQAGAEARRALARDGKVRVLVTLGEAAAPGLPGPSRASRLKARSDAQEGFVRALARHPGKRVRHRYSFSPSILLEVSDAATLDAIEREPGVARIDLDQMGSGGLEETRALIHADEVFEAGITGTGRIVAVLDTGVPDDHPDLAGAVLHRHHFLDGGEDTGPGATDGHGHGTNVTGIIASRGGTSPRGVAPGASIVAIKVLDDQNRGFLSDWAMGVEHAVALHESGEIRIDAINMSLVSDAVFPGECDAGFPAFSAACQAALDAGIAVYASSGNTGSATLMTSPACFSSVHSVGSVSDTPPDVVSPFTSRNRHLDLLAPGQSVTSLGLTYTGTSQASPHAAATACLVREVDPSLSPALILGVLQATGVPVNDAASGLTFSRLDALAAVSALQGPDCNANSRPDILDLVTGASRDCNDDGVPDECGEDLPGECLPFHRGDPNRSGDLDLSDAIFVFLYLFAGGEEPSCLESADADNDGDVNITDGIGILEFLFSGGAPISSPGPPGVPCGLDPDAPGSALYLGCAAYDRC
jgi:subtilisin family serine protease